jgi:GDPmannose 4,6-dehydratase
MKRALVTGVTGQDGSYLAEHLLGLGYEVHGTVRTTTSDIGVSRIAHLVKGDTPRLTLHVTDLGDSHSLMRLMEDVQPDEVYNLAAQSHVRASFDQPVHTGDVTGLGAVRMLEAVRAANRDTRFYQASSSEMFGAAPPPQNERTPFHPRSPYAVAKVFAYWATVNARESYGLHANNGILFNHECVPAATPIVVRRNGFIDIVAIEDVVPHRTDPRSGIRYTSPGGGLEVWDGEAWSPCTARTATWHEEDIVTVHVRGGVIESTADHEVFLDGGERKVRAETIRAGDHVLLAAQPVSPFTTVLTEQEAWLLGILAAEGYVSEEGSGRVTCHDDAVLTRTAAAWERVSAGTWRKSQGASSGFSERRTPALEFIGNRGYLRMLRKELYTRSGHKRIPVRILNAAPELQTTFLRAYNLGDGLRAGNGTDEFKSFRTCSPMLAAGLTWLARTALGRRVSIYLQPGALGGGSSYLINLNSGQTVGRKGAHLRKPQVEVRKTDRRWYRGWMFDLATESGRFAAGVGMVVVHNSPRRGREFVTRKVTDGIARICKGEITRIRLGNLDARRDWGHARDYVEAMHLILQLPEPVDLVIGTGESHSVRDFLDIAFEVVDRDWRDYVEIDPALYRPAEVDYLQADPTRARELLGWQPRTSFAELVEEMVQADLAAHGLDAG